MGIQTSKLVKVAISQSKKEFVHSRFMKRSRVLSMPESLGLRKLVPCPRNSIYFVAIKMGRRQGGPSRTGGRSGAYLNPYVTDEQRIRRLLFIANLPAAAGWLFFFVSLSTRMLQS